MSAAEGITRQYSGVIPGMSVGQNAVAKTYVDEGFAQLDADITSAVGAAAAAQNIANQGVSAANTAQSTANTAIGIASSAKSSADIAQDRINNLLVHNGDGTKDSELIDARKSIEGTSFPVLGARLNNVDAQLADTEKHLTERKNVLKYGVVGDGVTDDWAAMQAIFDEGGLIYIPSRVYFFSRRLNVNKTIDVLGERVYGSTNGTTFTFNIPDSDLTAINVSRGGRESSFENLRIVNISGSKTVDGFSTISSAGEFVTRLSLKFIYTDMFNRGFYLPACYLFDIHKCHASYNKTGFHFQGFSTAMHISACYALDNDDINYFINNLTYSTFDACASDGSDYGYWLINNRGVTFNGCGAENNGVTAMYMQDNNRNIVVSSLTGYGVGTIASPTTNLATMVHVAGANTHDIILNGICEASKLNTGTRTQSIVIGSGIVSELNNADVITGVTVGALCLYDGQYYSTAQPTSGYHKAGKMVWNTNSSGGVLGWKCYTSGTPGSWQTVVGLTSVSIGSTPQTIGQIAIVSEQVFVSIGTTSSADWVKVGKAVSVPATATSTGRAGDYASDASYFYTCYATNSWRRVAIATW